MTIKEFEILYWEHECSKTKLPKEYVPVTKFRTTTANGLTKAICIFIKLKGGQAERISSMGRVIDGRKMVTNYMGQSGMIGSNSYIPGTSTKGTADISIILKNNNNIVIPWKAEIKIGNDRQSENQKKYEQDIIKAGGHYSLVKNWEDFYIQYIELMNKK